MEFIPKYIRQTMAKRSKEIITAEEWNAIINMLIQQGDHNSEFLRTIAESNSTTEEIIQMINEAVFTTGAADMTKIVYDKNHDGVVDLAETVLEDSIKTNNIKDNAITQAKLSDALNKRLDYLYSSVSTLLIRFGAQAEIEGSEDLLLFGLDGNLEIPYKADVESLKILLSDTTLAADTITLNHWELNLTEQVKENKYYTLSNPTNKQAHASTLTNIVNAQANYSSVLQSVGSAASGERIYIDGLEHLEGNYYVANTEDGDFNYSFIVLEHNPDNNTFSVVNTFTIGGKEYDWDSELIKMGNHVFGRKSRDSSSGLRNYNTIIRITKNKITELTTFDNWDPAVIVGREGGYLYYIEHESDDSSSGVTSEVVVMFNGSTIYTCSSEYHRVRDLKQISGKYAYFYIEHWKDDTHIGDFMVNLITGNVTSLTSTQAAKFKGKTFYADKDGYHTYFGNGKYILQDDFTFKLIEEYPYEITTGGIDHGYYISENALYKLTPSEKKKIYDINQGTVTSGSTTYSPSFRTFNPDTLTGATLYMPSASGIPAGLSASTFTPGTVDLNTPLSEDFITPCYLTRQQSCVITPGTTKQIYLKPTTDENSYTRLELILNLNRALTDSDILKIECITVIDGTVNKKEILPLESNTNTTIYYDLIFDTPVSDIDVLVTASAQTEELKIIQILGGVDNEV